MANALKPAEDFNHFTGHFTQCSQGLLLVCNQAVLPCVEHVITKWHAEKRKSVPPCQQSSPECTSDADCESCRNSYWTTAIESAKWDPDQPLSWRNIDLFRIHDDPLELAKLFTIRLSHREAIHHFGDFDPASLLYISMRFAECHRWNVENYSIIKKVSDVRNRFAHMRITENLQIQQSEKVAIFDSFFELVDCFEKIHPHFLPGKTADMIREDLQKLKMAEIPVSGALHLHMFTDLEEVTADNTALAEKVVEQRAIADELRKGNIALREQMDELRKGNIALREQMDEWRKSIIALQEQKDEIKSVKTTKATIGELKELLKRNYRETYGRAMLFPWSLEELTPELPISLKILEEESPLVYEKSKVLKSIPDLFEIVDSKGNKRRQLIVYGNAATGKTTFMSQIAHQWSKGSGSTSESSQNLERFDFVFVISCCRIKPYMSLVEAINEQCLPPATPHSYLEKCLSQSQCLFLIDGYGELGTSEGNAEFLKDPLLEENFVIVTSRSSAVAKFCADHPKYLRVPISGMSVSQIHAYIRSVFTQQPEIADALIDEINANQSMQLLASILMMLPLICIIWQKQEAENRSLQVTIVVQIMVKYMSEGLQAKEGIEEHDIDELLRRVGKIAIRSLFENELYIDKEELAEEDLEYATALGLVQKDESQLGKHITFVHRAFQEYCAAMFWSSLYDLERERFIYFLQKLTKKNAVSYKYLIQFCCGLEPNAITLIAPHLLSLSNLPTPAYTGQSLLQRNLAGGMSLAKTSHINQSTVSESIDSQGGKFSLSDVDVELKIPQGALEKSTVVSVTVDATESHPAVGEDQLILGPVISCKPDGAHFLKPVTIVVPHSGVNITTQCLQVWSRSESQPGSWQKIYDGSTNFAQDDVSVIVEGSKIKLRVKHFSWYDFVTAPFSALSRWMQTPELALDILVYMYPVHVATSGNVCLRVYAIKKHDAESRRLVEEAEERNPSSSGMCCIPSGFVLKQSGKGLKIPVKFTLPKDRWEASEAAAEGNISYANIQNGGLGSRDEIMFLPKDEMQHAEKFEGCIGIEQEGNPDNTVHRVHFYDSMAKGNIKKSPEAEAGNTSRPPEASGRSALEQPARSGSSPGAKYQSGTKSKSRNDGSQFLNITQSRSGGAASLQSGTKPKSRNDGSQFLNITQSRSGAAASLQSGTKTKSRNDGSQFLNITQSRSGAAASLQSGSKTSAEKEEQSKIIPMFESLSISQDRSSSKSEKASLGDCGPFLKKIAMTIEKKWTKVASALDFTEEQSEEFDSKANRAVSPWWPAYKMLHAWQTKLDVCDFRQLKEILADAVRLVDGNLAEQIIA